MANPRGADKNLRPAPTPTRDPWPKTGASLQGLLTPAGSGCEIHPEAGTPSKDNADPQVHRPNAWHHVANCI
eukprot:CAMPEP_0204327014 /NCGR_PEP_ID=MMETSP0469-20131031/12264_1 /ASSEMBLY_ACC=CAM_ASM_000384 /TAXON_ID=2969 /ORGANISM="Oxyrrhis marina" /LENGTH=71 /DNA_ID=CAMNT_0051309177 /DNA_START=966 /DNA_END=1181 /DNA_ORIENTATION=+